MQERNDELVITSSEPLKIGGLDLAVVEGQIRNIWKGLLAGLDYPTVNQALQKYIAEIEHEDPDLAKKLLSPAERTYEQRRSYEDRFKRTWRPIPLVELIGHYTRGLGPDMIYKEKLKSKRRDLR